MEQWRQFQVLAAQLVLSRDAILLTVTLQARQNALQKTIYTGQQRHCAWIVLECSYNLVQ